MHSSITEGNQTPKYTPEYKRNAAVRVRLVECFQFCYGAEQVKRCNETSEDHRPKTTAADKNNVKLNQIPTGTKYMEHRAFRRNDAQRTEEQATPKRFARLPYSANGH